MLDRRAAQEEVSQTYFPIKLNSAGVMVRAGPRPNPPPPACRAHPSTPYWLLPLPLLRARLLPPKNAPQNAPERP
jgi:hypothetical protein